MSSFNAHGIKHLSASSLNLWSAMPGLWALRYLCGFREDSGPAAARGTSVEVGFLHHLHGRPDPEKVALEAFDNAIQGEVSEAIDLERGRIPGMVKQCQGWQPPGELRASQIKVECWLDGVSIPIIGYVDFSFDDVDVDLKTTKAAPSKPKPEHVRQVAIYRHARSKHGRLLYVTDKKRLEYDVDDQMRDAALQELTLTAKSLERFLSAFDNGTDALRCLPIDRDNFRWSQVAEKHYRSSLDGTLDAAAMRMLADAGLGMGFESIEAD